MNLSTLVIDNITELLLKIIEFTQTRQKILIQNINAMHTAGFVPSDLPVDEFSKLMFQALNEHAHSQRLLLQDSRNVKFGAGGSFKTTPTIDKQAKRLFEKDRNEYLRDQINKLLENSLNQRIATEMLKQRQADELCLGRCSN
jgi:flagellar basal body rod protein FlgB